MFSGIIVNERAKERVWNGEKMKNYLCSSGKHCLRLESTRTWTAPNGIFFFDINDFARRKDFA